MAVAMLIDAAYRSPASVSCVSSVLMKWTWTSCAQAAPSCLTESSEGGSRSSLPARAASSNGSGIPRSKSKPRKEAPPQIKEAMTPPSHSMPSVLRSSLNSILRLPAHSIAAANRLFRYFCLISFPERARDEVPWRHFFQSSAFASSLSTATVSVHSASDSPSAAGRSSA